jgi:hypothetical protein
MAITVKVMPELSDKTQQQIRGIVRGEYSRLTGIPVCVHCGQIGTPDQAVHGTGGCSEVQ